MFYLSMILYVEMIRYWLNRIKVKIPFHLEGRPVSNSDIFPDQLYPKVELELLFPNQSVRTSKIPSKMSNSSLLSLSFYHLDTQK